MATKSTNRIKRDVLRAAAGASISLLYSWLIKKQPLGNMMDLQKAALQGGAMIGSEFVTDYILPHLAHTKEGYSRSLQHQVIEPLLVGATVGFGQKYLFHDAEGMISNAIQAGIVDIASDSVLVFARPFLLPVIGDTFDNGSIF